MFPQQRSRIQILKHLSCQLVSVLPIKITENTFLGNLLAVLTIFSLLPQRNMEVRLKRAEQERCQDQPEMDPRASTKIKRKHRIFYFKEVQGL